MEFRERKRWLFLGLPWTFTVYTVGEEKITRNTGLFNKMEDDCYMYKVVDVKLEQSFWERMVKVGTVHCFTGDTTDSDLLLRHIKNAKAIKDFIFEAAETARMKRRTVNMQDIGSHIDIDGDGFPDT